MTAAHPQHVPSAPRVSIVMPVRDGASFLEQAVASILSQTLTDLELIVVDDGSTDRTPEILAAAASGDPRVRVERRETGGVVAALNEGCGSASAPYIARLDADDVALPDRLERQVGLLDAQPSVGLVGGAYFTTDEAGKRRAEHRPPSGDAALRARLSRFNVFAHPAVVFRREAFEQAAGYRLAEAEDYDLWLRISERWKLASVPSPVIEYRHHRGQVSLTRARDQALAMLAARVAAERRRAGGDDPLIGIERATTELLERLGVSGAEVAQTIADHEVRWATTLAELGDTAGASELLAAAAGPGSPYTARQVRARHALGRAVHASRGGKRLRSAGLVARAVVTDPGAVADEVSAIIGRRRPGAP